MAMTAGSVAVTSSTNAPVRSGSGMAVAIFDTMVTAAAAASPAMPGAPPTLGSTSAPYSASRPVSATDIANSNTGALAYYQNLAVLANGLASGLVTYIQSNATAHVTTQSLGRTPNPNNAATAILAPVAAVDVPIT